MTEQEAFKQAICNMPCHTPSTSDMRQFWNAALEWARTQQEPVGWQFYDSENKKWFNGMETNNHRKNTEEAGYIVRDLYTHPAPAQPVRLSEDEVESIRLEKYAYAAPADHFHEMVETIQDAMLAKGAGNPDLKELLPDDFTESKDWRESGVTGRIEWLKAMVVNYRQEVERLSGDLDAALAAYKE